MIHTGVANRLVPTASSHPTWWTIDEATTPPFHSFFPPVVPFLHFVRSSRFFASPTSPLLQHDSLATRGGTIHLARRFRFALTVRIERPSIPTGVLLPLERGLSAVLQSICSHIAAVGDFELDAALRRSVSGNQERTAGLRSREPGVVVS